MNLSSLFRSIAGENFRASGFVSRPYEGRHPTGGFIKRRVRMTFNADLVHDALQRRERARLRIERDKEGRHLLADGLRTWMHVVRRK